MTIRQIDENEKVVRSTRGKKNRSRPSAPKEEKTPRAAFNRWLKRWESGSSEDLAGLSEEGLRIIERAFFAAGIIPKNYTGVPPEEVHLRLEDSHIHFLARAMFKAVIDTAQLPSPRKVHQEFLTTQQFRIKKYRQALEAFVEAEHRGGGPVDETIVQALWWKLLGADTAFQYIKDRAKPRLKPPRDFFVGSAYLLLMSERKRSDRNAWKIIKALNKSLGEPLGKITDKSIRNVVENLNQHDTRFAVCMVFVRTLLEPTDMNRARELGEELIDSYLSGNSSPEGLVSHDPGPTSREIAKGLMDKNRRK